MVKISTAPSPGLHKDVSFPHSQEFELYHNSFSLCSAQVRLCLAEKGIRYVGHHVDLIMTGRYQNCTPEFLEVNPGATVPVLVHDGHPVYESTRQVEYIDAVYGDEVRLMPPSLSEEVADWVDRNSLNGLDLLDAKGNAASMASRIGNCVLGLTLPLFASMVGEIPVSEISYGLLQHPDRRRPALFLAMRASGPRALRLPPVRRIVRDSRDAARLHLVELDDTLSDGRKWLLGDTFTLADVGLVPILRRAELGGWEFLWNDLPHVTTWWERAKSRPSYRSAVLDVEPDLVREGARRLRKWREEKPWLRELLDGNN